MRRKISSKARLWVYDRRSELVTRAFTLFGAKRSSPNDPRRSRITRVLVIADTCALFVNRSSSARSSSDTTSATFGRPVFATSL